jgi:hypothetical protein
MPIKNINDLIMQGIKPERVKSLRKEKEKLKPNPHFKMQEIVPPLNRGDFLNSWKEDRAQLEKVRKERDDAVKETKKLKGMLNKGR